MANQCYQNVGPNDNYGLYQCAQYEEECLEDVEITRINPDEIDILIWWDGTISEIYRGGVSIWYLADWKRNGIPPWAPAINPDN